MYRVEIRDGDDGSNAVTPSANRRAYTGTLVANAIILATGIATGIFSARLLGVEDRGLLAALMLWPSLLAGVGFLSLNQAVVVQRAQQAGSDTTLVVTSVLLAFILAVVSVGVGVLLLPLLLGGERETIHDLAKAYLVAFAPASFIALTLLAVDQGEKKFFRFNALRLLPSSIYLASIVALWTLGHVSVGTFLWMNLAGTGITLVLCVAIRRGSLFGAPRLAEARALLRRARGFHAVALTALLCTNADRAILALIAPNRELGLYVAGLTVATSGLAIVTNTVNAVLLPRMGTSGSQGLPLLAGSLRTASAVITAGTVVLSLITPWLVPVVFGFAFADAVPLTIVLLLAYLPLALRQITAIGLMGLGDARTGWQAEAVALVTLVPICVITAPKLGGLGVACGMFGANLAALAFLTVAIKRRYSLTAWQWLRPDMAPALRMAQATWTHIF